MAIVAPIGSGSPRTDNNPAISAAVISSATTIGQRFSIVPHDVTASKTRLNMNTVPIAHAVRVCIPRRVHASVTELFASLTELFTAQTSTTR